jgi:CRP/FNR family transcriptional regulator, nitrogen oxide reductase regulator
MAMCPSKGNVDSRSASIAALSSRFLTGIDKAGLEDILGVAQLRRFPAGHNITTGGCRASNLYLIQSGRARLYHLTKAGELVLLAWLVPGDVAGLAASLKTPPSYMATAESTCECEALAWEHLAIRKLVSCYPLLAENALHIALAHLRTYIDRHVALVTKNAEARLAETLLRLSEQTGEFHPEGIEIRATNDELAAFASISPFTASRVLRNWDRAGTLSKARGRILLQDPEALMVD